ncbi:hypothetical protein D3C86_2007110 [compost metagenome]
MKEDVHFITWRFGSFMQDGLDLLNHVFRQLINHIGNILIMQIEGHAINSRAFRDAIHGYFFKLKLLKQFDKGVSNQLARAKYARIYAL